MNKFVIILKNNKFLLSILILQIIYFIHYFINDYNLLNNKKLTASDSQGLIGYALVNAAFTTIMIVLTIIIVTSYFITKRIKNKKIDKFQFVLGLIIIILPIIIAITNDLIFPIWIYL